MSGPVTRTRRGAIAALAVTAAAGLSLSGIPQGIASPTTHKGVGSASTSTSPKASLASKHQADRKGSYDARVGSLKSQLRATDSLLATRGKAFRSLVRSVGPQGVVDMDPATGTPRNLGRLDGFLTGTSSATASAVALGYVRSHLAALGLNRADLKTLTLRDHWVDVAGIHHLSWTQSVDEIPVFGNGLRASVTRRGQLISIQGSPISGLARMAKQTSASPRLSAADARASAAKAVGGSAAVSTAATSKRGNEVSWANNDQAQLVWFAAGHGIHLGWSTYVQAGGDNLNYQQVIDATTGAVLYRHDNVNNDNGDARVFRNYPGAKIGGTQQVVNFFTAGFLPRGAHRLTHGKYVAAWSDVNDNNHVDKGETVRVPAQTSHHPQYVLTRFKKPASIICSAKVICTWNPHKARSWRVNRRADVTQGFYFDSTYHNYLERAPFGFTPRAGNFERSGGDPVLLNALDGANTDHGLPDGGHVDNANMDTPPDGIPPTMQMYLFHAPGTTYAQEPIVPASSVFDPTVILHEYTHGLSNRLVVDTTGNSTLNSIQSGAMGEAWSDYYAIDYLVAHGLLKDTAREGQLLSGNYIQAGVDTQLFRTMPIDCTVGTTSHRCANLFGGTGGYTYGDFPSVIGFPEVHGSGEIWGQTLWSLRSRLGHRVTGMLVTRAMSLSPDDPSFLDERNAILQADLAAYGGAHRDAIWRVFAHRGMGFFAATLGSTDTTPLENFRLPPGPTTPRGNMTGRVINRVTGRPVANALVVINGHGSGFVGDYSDKTDAAGRYAINNVFVGKYPQVVAFKAGYEVISKSVRVRPAGSTLNFKPRRDWAAASGGGFIKSFNGPDYSVFGCGPDHAIDLDQGQGWGSTVGDDAGTPTNTVIPKHIVVALPATVTVSSFGVNPTATCGDPPDASTGDYRIETSPNGTTWTTAAQGTFTTADQNHLVTVPVSPAIPGVQYVRFTILGDQVPNFATTCPSGPFAGCVFMDMSELEVFGTR